MKYSKNQSHLLFKILKDISYSALLWESDGVDNHLNQQLLKIQ